MSLGFVLSACGPKSDNRPILVDSSDAYTQNLSRAKTLSADILTKVDRGGSIDGLDTDNLKSALQLFEGLIAYNPTNYGLFLATGRIELALQQPIRAERRFLQAFELFPSQMSEADRENYAQCNFQMGQALISQGKASKAVSYVKKAIELAPKNPDYLTGYASALVQQKQYNTAMQLLNKAQAEAPNHEPSRRLLKLLELDGKGK